MPKRRYEILLPLKHNDGRPVSDLALNDTRTELLKRFEGISISPHPVLGNWLHEGHQFDDQSVRVLIDVDDTPDNRYFFVDYKQVLMLRFQQIEIYIISYPIDIV